VGDTTRRIMKHVFDCVLARKLNFAGRGEKTGIGHMAITAAIICKLLVLYILFSYRFGLMYRKTLNKSRAQLMLGPGYRLRSRSAILASNWTPSFR